jgi:hypothetical protein
MGKGRNYLQCKGTFYKYCIPPLSTITLRDLTRSPVNRYALQARGDSLSTPSVDDDDAPRYYGWKRKNPHRLSNAEFAMRSVEAKMRRQAEEEARRKQEEEQLLRRERDEAENDQEPAAAKQEGARGRAWSVVSEAALQRATVEAELDRWLERSEEPACMESGAPGRATDTGGGPFRGRPAIPVLRRANSPEEGMTSTDTEDEGGNDGMEDDGAALPETAHTCFSKAAVAGTLTAASEGHTAHSDAAVEVAGSDSGAMDCSDGCPANDIIPASSELSPTGLPYTPPEPTADKVAAYVVAELAAPAVACPLLLTKQPSHEPSADPDAPGNDEGAAEGSDGGSDTLELPAVILLGNGPSTTGASSFEQVVTGPVQSPDPAAATNGSLPRCVAGVGSSSAVLAQHVDSSAVPASEEPGSMALDEELSEDDSDDEAGWSLSATAARLKQQAAAESERARLQAEAEEECLRVQAEAEQERLRVQDVEEAERQIQRAEAEAAGRAQAEEAATLKAQEQAQRAAVEEAERAWRVEEEAERAAAEEAERIRRAEEEEDEECVVWSLAAVAARLRRDQPPAPAAASGECAAQPASPVQTLTSPQPPGTAQAVVAAQSPASVQPAAAEAEPVLPTQAAQPAQQKPPAASKRSRFDEVVAEEEQPRTYPRLSQHTGTVGGPPAQSAAAASVASAPPHPRATQQTLQPAALAQRPKASRPRFGSTDDVSNLLVEQQEHGEGDSVKKQKLTSGNLRTLQSSLPPSTGMRARSPPRTAVSPPRSKYGPAAAMPPRRPFNPQLEALGGVSSPSFGLAAPQRQPSEHSSSSAPAGGAHKSRFGSAEINFEYNELDDETTSDDGEPNPTRKRKGGLRKAKLPLAQQTTGSTNAEGISRKRPPIYFDTSVRFETIPPPAGTGDSIAPVDISALLQGGSEDEFGRRRAAGGGNGRRRDSDRGRDRDRDRGVDRGRERDREKQRDWDRGGGRDRDDRERDRDGNSGRDHDREAAREREWDRDSRSNGDSSHRDRDRDRDGGRERDTDRGRDNDRGRERSREANCRDRDQEPDRGRGDSSYYSGKREPARRSPSPPPARTRRGGDEALNTSVPWSMDRAASTVSPQSASASTAAPLPAPAAAPRLVKRTKQYTDMWGAVHLMEEWVEEPPPRRVVTPAAAPPPAPSSALASVAAPYTSAAHPPAAGIGAPAAAFSSAQFPFELVPDTAEEADLMRRMRERLAAVQAAQANLDQRGGAPGTGAGSSYYSSRPSRTSMGGALG